MRPEAHTPRPDAPVSLLYGDSLELRRRAAEAILAACLAPEDRAMSLVRLWGKEATPDRLRAEAASLSLLSPQRVVLVENTDDLASRDQDQLAELVRHLPPGFKLILLAEPGERGKPAIGQKLLTAVGEVGQIITCSTQREAIPALVAEAARLGKILPGPVAAKLAELTGDYDTACRELEKLTLFIGDRDRITAEDVDAMTSASAETTMFVFCDALGIRDGRAALRSREGLLPPGTRRGAGIGLVGMIARQFRLLWQAKAAREVKGEAPPEFRRRFPQGQHNYFNEIKNKDWLADRLGRQAAKWTHPELARAFLLLRETDRRLKGMGDGNLDDRTALQLFIAGVCK